ncbi:hypothetical protein RUND412_002849 [Rhizina undulata]
MEEKSTVVVSAVNDNIINFKYAKLKPDVNVNNLLKEYRLHSHVLQLCSPWFANSFADACHIPDISTFKTNNSDQSMRSARKCFYRQPLVFSPDITPKDLLFLIDTAEKYDALEACRAAIHGALFNIVDIDEKVCKSPVSYLFIAYKFESTMLFRETFIHAAGQWHIDNFPDVEDNHTLPKEIVALVEEESKRLPGNRPE